MNKRAKYFDIFFLTLIGVLFYFSGIRHFQDGFILPLNTYLGFLCWLTTVILMIRGFTGKGFFLAYLLIFSSLNIISFTAESIAFGSSHLIEYKGFYFTSLSINPISLVLLILYFICNGSIIKKLYKRIFRASDMEIADEHSKLVTFYYEKFAVYDTEEWKLVTQNFKDYPEAAQAAINKIIIERKEIK